MTEAESRGTPRESWGEFVHNLRIRPTLFLSIPFPARDVREAVPYKRISPSPVGAAISRPQLP